MTASRNTTVHHEKRHSPRYANYMSVLLETENGRGAGERLETQTLDVSCEGLSVRVNHDLPVGSIIAITVEPLERDTRFKFLGEVNWCTRHLPDTYDAGIRILPDNTDQVHDWASFVTAQGVS